MQSDIELAVTGLSGDRRATLAIKVPHAYTVEDRSSTGYGLVIRSDSSESNEEINAKLESFLKTLLPIADIVRGHGSILRVAVYSSLATTTTTFSLSCINLLRELDAKLEVSVYPLDQD